MPEVPFHEEGSGKTSSGVTGGLKPVLFLPYFEKGGVERMMVNLARGFADLGCHPDFVVRNAGSPYLSGLPDEARLVELDNLHRHPAAAASLYLEREKPVAVLTSKEENDELAIAAKERAGTDTRIVVRVPVHVTSRLKHKRRGPVKRWLTYRKLRRVLHKADSVVAVSRGVAQDITAITGLPEENIHVIHNPVITPELDDLAAAAPEHDWLHGGNIPVLLGIGRLGRQKNFELLIRALARVRSKIDCRLIILGDGRRRDRLVRLAEKLDLSPHVDLPGFVTNPYAYLSRSSLFVLSSDWEGSPNVLTEALALGVPVVSTDCDSGPREILQNGRYGDLVAVGDTENLATAICRTLSSHNSSEVLKGAAREYTAESSARRYLEILYGGSFSSPAAGGGNADNVHVV